MKIQINKYPTYKPSNIDWIGEIPNHWKITKVKYTASLVTDGSHFSPEIQDEGKYYVTVSNITKFNTIDFSDCKKINNESFENLKKNGCQPHVGDILLTKDGTIGRAAIVDKFNEFVILSSLGLIRVKENINNRYIFHFLLSGINIDQMYSMIRGSGITRLTIGLINDLLVVLPPLQEQQAIVSYLDEKTALIDELILKKERKIELLKEQRAALINQAVTKGLDKDVPMKDSKIEWIGEVPEHWGAIALKFLVSSKITDGPHETPTFIDEGVPFISVESIKENKIDFNFIRGFISKEQHLEYSKKCLPQKNDVFIVKSGSTTGKIAIVETDLEFNIWSPLALVRSNYKKILPRFCYIALQSEYFQRSIQQSWSFGTQPNIGMGVIENLRVVIPPLSEQKSIVAYLDEQTTLIDKNIALESQKIEKLKEYRQSLISNVVTGKICVA